MSTAKLKNLEKEVQALYESLNPSRDDWADWLYKNHVLVVYKFTEKLSKRFGANKEVAMAAALLHDIADAVMKRDSANHEAKSIEIAEELLRKPGFNESQVNLIINDVIRYHGCHNGESPKSIEGKVLATADALAHLKTDFYEFAARSLKDDFSPKEVKEWVLKKLDRDYLNKIQFEEIRREAKKDYEVIKELFSR
jgi:putative nucleotidyltransferase with HDIG domain